MAQKHFFMDSYNQMWIVSSPNSGITNSAFANNSRTTYITNFKKDDKEHYYPYFVNKLQELLLSDYKPTKVIKNDIAEIKIYKLNVYNHKLYKQSEFDIFGGFIKPNEMFYISMTKNKSDDTLILNLFKTRNEALTFHK